MKQGTTFVLIVSLEVDIKLVDSIIFTIKNKGNILTKENWSFNNGNFEIPFTQEETVQLEGRTLIEAQINFEDGNVAKTNIKEFYIKESLATRIIDGNIATREGQEVELFVEEAVIFTSEDYSKLANKPKINGVVLLGDVSLDALNIASKEYVEEEIAKFDFIKVVDVLPEVGLPNRFYYVPKTNGGKNDLFDEYAWINGDWEYYGTKQIEVDLTDYVKKTDYAKSDKAGVVIANSQYGLQSIMGALSPLGWDTYIDNRSQAFMSCSLIDYGVMKALTDPKKHEWTEEQKTLARKLFGLDVTSAFGVQIYGDSLRINRANKSEIDGRVNFYKPITPDFLDYAVKKALSDCKLSGNDAWTDEEKASARDLLGVTDLVGDIESLLGGI